MASIQKYKIFDCSTILFPDKCDRSGESTRNTTPPHTLSLLSGLKNKMYHQRQLPQHTTGADLSFALSAFQRIKDQLKSERSISREKNKQIIQLKHDLTHAQKQVRTPRENQLIVQETTKQYMHAHDEQIKKLERAAISQTASIKNLRQQLDDNRTSSKRTIVQQRLDADKLREILKRTTEELTSVRIDAEIQTNATRRTDLENKRLKQLLELTTGQLSSMTTERNGLREECLDIRTNHKDLLLESKKLKEKHKLIELQWDMNYEMMSTSLEQCREDAHTLADQVNEDARRKMHQLRDEQNAAEILLRGLVREERSKLEEVTIDLNDVKRKNHDLERKNKALSECVQLRRGYGGGVPLQWQELEEESSRMGSGITTPLPNNRIHVLPYQVEAQEEREREEEERQRESEKEEDLLLSSLGGAVFICDNEQSEGTILS